MDRIVSIGEIRTAWGSGENGFVVPSLYALRSTQNKQNQNFNYRRELHERSDVDTDILNIGHI